MLLSDVSYARRQVRILLDALRKPSFFADSQPEDLMRSHGAMFLATCSMIILAGCAGEAQRPDAEIARANTLIEQAEKAGAQRYAAAELQSARDKLQQVDAAVKDGKGDRALHLAQQASADAELANARAASGEAQRAAGEVEKGTETLREEADRSETTTNPDGTPR
jgi:hypothetical protein